MAYLLFRIALVAGVVYGTKAAGIWGSAEDSVVLYENARRQILPIADKLMDRLCCFRCKDSKPKEIEVKPFRESMRDAWNDTVKKSFYLLGIDIPIYYHRFTDDLGHTLDNMSSKDGKHLSDKSNNKPKSRVA
ncbi:hypothetical protein KR032_006000 [Drosophila birchii]|nr:hypothetical protein KR032_006000 [Drosophila birchii]